jgi:hypothetical protein
MPQRRCERGVVGIVSWDTACSQYITRVKSKQIVNDPPHPPGPPHPPEAATGATIRINVTHAPDVHAPAEEPAPATAPEQAVPSSGATLEDQRAAILRMVADGRITPEEADLLLEALGTDQERPFRSDDHTGM